MIKKVYAVIGGERYEEGSSIYKIFDTREKAQEYADKIEKQSEESCKGDNYDIWNDLWAVVEEVDFDFSYDNICPENE